MRTRLCIVVTSMSMQRRVGYALSGPWWEGSREGMGVGGRDIGEDSIFRTGQTISEIGRRFPVNKQRGERKCGFLYSRRGQRTVSSTNTGIDEVAAVVTCTAPGLASAFSPCARVEDTSGFGRTIYTDGPGSSRPNRRTSDLRPSPNSDAAVPPTPSDHSAPIDRRSDRNGRGGVGLRALGRSPTAVQQQPSIGIQLQSQFVEWVSSISASSAPCTCGRRGRGEKSKFPVGLKCILEGQRKNGYKYFKLTHIFPTPPNGCESKTDKL